MSLVYRLGRSKSTKSTLGHPVVRSMKTMSLKSNEEQLERMTGSIEDWFRSARFTDTHRSYGARLIATKRGRLPIHEECYGNLQARKLLGLLEEARRTREPVMTMGVLDPVQQAQMAHHLPIVYSRRPSEGWRRLKSCTIVRSGTLSSPIQVSIGIRSITCVRSSPMVITDTVACRRS